MNVVVLIDRKALKDLETLPKKVVVLFREPINDLQYHGLKTTRWDIKKMSGQTNHF